MRKIDLGDGHFALVDDEDFLFLNKWKWRRDISGFIEYAKMGFWDAADKKNVVVYMHRLIMGMPGKMTIDHIDHNGLNNQKSNLRVCTKAENLRNSIVRRTDKTSQYRGVSISKAGIITAYYNHNGKRIYLGTFKTEEEAARARDEAVYNIDRKFSYLNFPIT